MRAKALFQATKSSVHKGHPPEKTGLFQEKPQPLTGNRCASPAAAPGQNSPPSKARAPYFPDPRATQASLSQTELKGHRAGFSTLRNYLMERQDVHFLKSFCLIKDFRF